MPPRRRAQCWFCVPLHAEYGIEKTGYSRGYYQQLNLEHVRHMSIHAKSIFDEAERFDTLEEALTDTVLAVRDYPSQGESGASIFPTSRKSWLIKPPNTLKEPLPLYSAMNRMD